MQLQWWCSASGRSWTWEWRAYPGVWLLLAGIAYTYWRFTRGRGSWIGWTGVALVWIALDWPLGPLAAGYTASAHATQFMLLAMIAPPLILMGVAPHATTGIRKGGVSERILSLLTYPIVAATLFNVVAAATHVPAVVDSLMPSQWGAALLDLSWLVAGILFWWPVLVKVPERPHFPALIQIVYIFLGTTVHTILAVVMLLAHFPLYGIYELAPPTRWLTPLEDLELAGGIMEVVGLVIVFTAITILFFRWVRTQEMEEDRLQR